ncbi:MAG TPA: hypothetical protein PKC43_03685 [Phycisphaerales bacterium]|nr:hypothetical protein [Phycisphaerales bacterium]HMP36528.1 hypothetical protein [Phycisphaerales bacterium]
MSTVLYIASRSGGPDAGRWAPVGRLDHDAGVYRFVYTHGAKLFGFAAFPGMDDLQRVYESDELFPLFANRLLSPSRPEYEAFLRWGGFSTAQPPDPLLVLGVTQGLRQTDPLEVFACPTPDAAGRYQSKFFLHGVRWMHDTARERIARLAPGERLTPALEIGSRFDPSAVSVRTDDAVGRSLIGYVPRYLAKDVRDLCATCDPEHIELAVERVNTDAPLQHRVLCRVSACWPDDFSPCSGEAFQPLVELPSRMHPTGRAGAARG